MGDTGSTRPMRGVASRVAAAVVGAALAAAMMAVPRDALALQDSIQAAAQRGAGHADAGAASAASTPVQRADSSAPGLLDADADGDGVPDFMDRCLGTAPGTAVGRDGCAARARLGLLPVAGTAAAFAILLALLLMRFVRRTLRDASDLPPLVFTPRNRDDDTPTDPRPAASVAPAGAGWIATVGAPWADGARQEPTAAAAPVAPRGAALPEHGFAAPQPAGDVPRGRGGEAPIRPAASAAPPRPAAPAHGSGESYTELVDARTVRFYRPLDATMQLLPGRLEIVEGAEPGHVIRFVRIPGVPPEITFGRSSGTPPLHVQLLLPTVSRRHARMRYADGGWRIINHSRTNPLVVNGVELVGDGESRTLHDGDRIEMGEVAFVYRER